MWFRRGRGEACLKAWENLLVSGKYDTDQAALDYVEMVPLDSSSSGGGDGSGGGGDVGASSCPHAFAFPARHLLFAKDYIGMLLTSGQTFVHLTAAGRPETQDYFYREIVVPRWRQALHPPLNPSKLAHRKTCAAPATQPQQAGS